MEMCEQPTDDNEKEDEDHWRHASSSKPRWGDDSYRDAAGLLFDAEQFINKKNCMRQVKLDDYVGQNV